MSIPRAEDLSTSGKGPGGHGDKGLGQSGKVWGTIAYIQ